MLTQEKLKELLHYDPETGFFTWRVSRGRSVAGSVAGYLHPSGYVNIRIKRGSYLAHRLAWFYVYGEFPVNQLDHINRARADNRIANLRLATRSENQQNRSKQRTNTSGVTGVNWHKQHGKWNAKIMTNGRRMCLGFFDTIADAAAARAAAKAKLHTFHPEDNNVTLTEENSNHRHDNC